MPAIDTNILVRLLIEDDPRQTKSAEAFVEKGAWVSHLVLAEAVWVLRSAYDIPPKKVADAVAKLAASKEISLQDPDVVSAALDLFRAHAAIGFSDCLILEIARKAGQLPLGTFDRALAKLPDTVRL